MKIISILGSTGSIGCSALDVIKLHPDKFDILGEGLRKTVQERKQRKESSGKKAKERTPRKESKHIPR